MRSLSRPEDAGQGRLATEQAGEYAGSRGRKRTVRSLRGRNPTFARGQRAFGAKASAVGTGVGGLAALLLLTSPALAQRGKLRTYTPPVLDPEPELTPAPDIASVEVKDPELVVLARPSYTAPLLGAVVKGARLELRGTYDTPRPQGCAVRRWYAIKPAGYVCGRGVRPSSQPPTTDPVLKVEPGERVPFKYYMVYVKEGEENPLYLSLADLESNNEPFRKLGRGDSVAVEKKIEHNGESYWLLVDGMVTSTKGTAAMGPSSSWQGLKLDATTTLPFAWTTWEKTKVLVAPDPKAEVLETLPRRQKVDILEEKAVEVTEKRRTKKKRYLRIGTNQWVDADDLNEVRKLARPDGTQGNDRWIDVNLGEQVLVAYEKDQPVYATLISSGRAIRTPRGDYRVWAKASATSMKSQKYEDKHYYVHKVPWVLFFQAHNAIHGAYWHDRFGQPKSHGCVNVSPLDARYLFEWATPALPPGWNGIRPVNLLESITVHVRDSRKNPEWVQERPIGPPDKKEEQKKLELAEKRRAEAAQRALEPRPAAPGSPSGSPPLEQAGAGDPGSRQKPPPAAGTPAAAPAATNARYGD